eukprot:11578821-Alexandrium_andersonii.AAC.1
MRAACAFRLGTRAFRLPQVIIEVPDGDRIVIANMIKMHKRTGMLLGPKLNLKAVREGIKGT